MLVKVGPGHCQTITCKSDDAVQRCIMCVTRGPIQYKDVILSV